ncbi:23S rRNA (uracil(1939)-C(5))-methyltransferase RlmD [Cesiribacter andamanensis]|uniref:Putative RNA methyltransferase n=1 Tax=Cesiribacter andamanensis AMV16 TaxID=1279009 RepID=M7NSS5_9BACT|nr:23S rRNA (uracil(1939)-C(5))-methyltransferase RlmD [Cesiribacter andamanensis]EMR01549.1 putative RNA methyltransferase [Cesiribacter andamanensis AMV16]
MAKLKKNQVLEKLEIAAVAAEGKCVARHEGQVIFIAGVAPGDVADVRITRTRSSFAEGMAIRFHSYSSLRQQPFCQHFHYCGGCKWQHLTYESQLQFKRQQVLDNMERIAKVALPEVPPVIGSQKTSMYRNKLEYTFSNRKWLTQEELQSGLEIRKDALGFHMSGRFDRVLDIEYCHLQPDPSNLIRNELRTFAHAHNLPFYDLVVNEGFIRNLIIRTSSTGETMVIVQFARPHMEEVENVMAFLKERFPEITSLQYIINQKFNETYYDQEVVLYAGRPWIEEEMEGLRFRIGPKSFYQTNSDQAYTLYKVTRDFAGLTGQEVVYDLYTGTGTIANFVARQAGLVIGVESVPEAIEDAKLNSELNGIANTRFFAGDMRYLLTEEFIQQQGRPDVIITDPPRAGMHEDVVQVLLTVAAKRIVYVSCNPATQARDVQWLSEKYDVKAIQPVDMFPHTHHIENVMLLELRQEA